MRISNIEIVKYEEPMPVYDVILATPYNNFLIKTNNKYIVSHNCGLMDEVNFAQGSNVDYTKSKIMGTYRSIKRRMQSRFTRGGILAAKLFLVSSKKSDQDFIESYIETVKGDTNTLIIDEPQWNVKPPGTFSNKRFTVAVGDKKIRSRVIQDGEDKEGLIKQGYRLIDVPLELKRDFERDVDSALMEFAGISSSLVTKFISYDSLENAYCNTENPFTNNIISIGTNDNLLVQDFFRPELVDNRFVSKPLFIHIDASLTGDRTGISGVWSIGLREEYQYMEGEYVPMQEIVYKHAFSIGIQCPAGAEISLEKNRKFIYYLRHTLGWNIQKVTLDGFQSADSKQQLRQAGYDADILSLDKTPDGYLYLKASINEKRISLLNNTSELEDELINLERNNMSGKIDHPVNGSKDIADSLAGALFSASRDTDKNTMFVVEDYRAISEANVVSDSKEDILLNNLLNDISDKSYKDENELSDISLSDALNTTIALVDRERQQELKNNKKLQDMKNNLTPTERRIVSDNELEDMLYRNSMDDDILIF